mgnify:CR=1 FL=1
MALGFDTLTHSNRDANRVTLRMSLKRLLISTFFLSAAMCFGR